MTDAESFSAAVALSVIVPGQPPISGTAGLLTMTRKVHVVLFPLKSTAVYVTAVESIGKSAPHGWLDVTVGSLVQLSVAVRLGSGTFAKHEFSATTAITVGQS